MLRSVTWLGDSGDGGGWGDLVRVAWTGGLGWTLVCRGGSFGACGGLGLREGGVNWGVFRGGSGGGSIVSSVSPNSGGGGSNGVLDCSLSSLWSSFGIRCCVARLAVLDRSAVPLRLDDCAWSSTRAGRGFCEAVGFSMFSSAAAYFDLSSGARKDKLDLGLTESPFERRSPRWTLAAGWLLVARPPPCECWLDLCLSLSLAANKRLRGEATDASRDAPLSPPFKLRSLRSSNGLNLPVWLRGPLGWSLLKVLVTFCCWGGERWVFWVWRGLSVDRKSVV